MKCPNCQTENREEATFCRDCGQPLQNDLKCPSCGSTSPSGTKFCDKCGQSLTESSRLSASKNTADTPTSFANGRYTVKKKLGEGGKKKVYLAHDTVLDRDVAFALIKTEGLDDSARTRITREAQAMGRLGDHPHIVTVFDYGDEAGQPFIVQPCITGGDVEDLIKKAPEHKVPIDEVIKIGKAVCQGLIFSHSQGIIHRDLKPGNVMLTADGTAKICDFGLAIAMDMSRLTVAGMMVGTVSYMPPEQAMGGQISEKADLYSLGAMLYEMVTGRPPFIGDDSISIIGQHINTPPVAPSWHRADLPPALETLILQLLEKDPEKRPASAQVVLEALTSIDIGQDVKEPSVQAPSLTDNPLYRRVFVGREQEQKQLQAAFDAALSGQGALMMVVGEPGIGKTALTEQVSTYVKLRGGRTLVGHCYEEGSLSLPYLAFVEAMRTYILSRESDDLKKELGTGAADVARIVSEIREKLKIRPRAKADPEEERYRLMQGVSDFLCHAADIQPLLIVLEDLHDADKGTLDMLTHVARHLAGSRLLIVGTYRDVEVDRSHPLSAALAELRRLATYGRVLLRGLNTDEVGRMLEGITHEELPWSLGEAVHRQTEGNPLFVQEVIRYLTEEKLLVKFNGTTTAADSTPVEMNIPEGLRDVIGKRLSKLSESCNRLLSIAAVIGREFRLDVLKKVADLTEDDVFASIEEAKGIAILEEHSSVGETVTYRFAHAFFRRILYEENIAPRRIRLHQQVAKALEEVYTSRLQEHAAELAEHFSYSTEQDDLTKAVRYGEMAARRAYDVYDYGEAARLLQQALKVQEVLDPGDKGKKCDLLIVLGDALVEAGQPPRRVLDREYPEAFALAEALGDKKRAGHVCFLAGLALTVEGLSVPQLWTSPEASEWAARADRYAEPGTIERVRADGLVAVVTYFSGDRHRAVELFTQALNQARELDDPETFWYSAYEWYYYARTPGRAGERLRLAEELIASPRNGVRPITLATGLSNVSFSFLDWGRRQPAEQTGREIDQLAERSGHVFLATFWGLMGAVIATLDGRLEKAEKLIRDALARGEELGFTGLGNVMAAFTGYFRIKLLLGKSEEALQFANTSFPLPSAQALCLAHMGLEAEAAKILEQIVIDRYGFGSAEDETAAYEDIMNLEAVVVTKDYNAAGLLLERFTSCSPFISTIAVTCTARHLGGAAALLERYDEARKYYQEAIKVCAEMPFRPELALSKLGLAELLLEHFPDEKKEALEHLDFAIKEFREMKMQPSLERALRHKDILKA